MRTGIQKCLDDHPAPNRTFVKALDHGTVSASDVTIEKVGVSAGKIQFSLPDDAPDAEPSQVAGKLIDTVDYLQEKLSIIEHDQQHSHVQIRSTKPTLTDFENRYYEIDVRPRDITVSRYCSRKGEPRHPTSVDLTRESFERFCRDLDDSMR